MIKAILACDDEGGVSRDGTLPWPKNTKDLQWFKENTLGHVVVMGSTTWKDPHMPRPLPRRINVLVTSQAGDYQDVITLNGNLIKELKRLEEEFPSLIIWVIGGPNIIEQSLGVVDEFYLSRIPGKYNCDTFLPLKKIETLFELSWEEQHLEVRFEIWKKRKINAAVS
jgi:dihydrofolate reductase